MTEAETAVPVGGPTGGGGKESWKRRVGARSNGWGSGHVGGAGQGFGLQLGQGSDGGRMGKGRLLSCARS